MNRSVLGWLAVLLLFSGGMLLYIAIKTSRNVTGGAGGAEKTHAPLATERLVGADEPILTKFELTDRTEKKIGSADLAGKIHVVSFFFASCPASCKTQNHKLSELEREFGKQGVKFLAITCDPKTDTPAKLREYASTNYNAPLDTWYFLTGDLLYTRRIAGEIYGVALDEKSHVEKFILIDRAGQIRGRYGWANDNELQTLKREIRLMLAETPATQPAASNSEKPAEDKLPTEQSKTEEANSSE